MTENSPVTLTPLFALQAYEDQVSLVRVAQAQVEACEDELNSRVAELDALQVSHIASLDSLMGVSSFTPRSLNYLTANASGVGDMHSRARMHVCGTGSASGG